MSNFASIDPFSATNAAPADDNIEEQSEEEQADVSRVMRLFEAANVNASARIQDDNLYLSAILGDQYLAVDQASGTVYRILDSQQSQFVSQNNQLIPMHLALWGKLTRGQPDFQVSPGSGSLDEIQGAKAAERFIEFYRTARNTKQVTDKAKGDVTWSALGGLVELTWDPMGGSDFWHCFTCGYSTEEELDGEVECPSCEAAQEQYAQAMQQFQMQQEQMAMGVPPPLDEMGMPLPPMQPPQEPPPPGMLQSVNRGGPSLSDLDPRNLFPQPGCEKWENVQWYIVREALPVNLVRAMFPDKALTIWPESEVYPNHGARMSVNLDQRSVRSEELQDHVYLYRCVEKPSGLYPQGRITFVANRRLLGAAPGFFKDFGRLPLFRFGWIPVRGSPYFRPPAADAWHRQRELNRLETQMSEHTSLVARTKVIIPYGSRIAVDELSAQSAQVLMPSTSTANMVRYLAPPPMSQDIYNRRELIGQDIRMTFAVTIQEAAGATDPNGRYAAIAEAESDQTVGPIIRAHNQEEADMMRCLLVLVQKYGDPEEKFYGLGDDNQELYSFQDLMFRAKRSNVAIVPSDGMSSNSAIRQQQANTQLQLGLYGDPATGTVDKFQYAKAAGLKLPGLVPSMSDTEVQAANAAIKILEDGHPFQPKPYDDANIFVSVLLSWLRSNGRRQEQKNPTLVQQVTDLMMYYQQQLFLAQQAQAAAAAPPEDPAAGGASPSSGSTSAPGGSPQGAPQDTAGEAEQIKKGADQAGEAAVKAGQAHES